MLVTNIWHSIIEYFVGFLIISYYASIVIIPSYIAQIDRDKNEFLKRHAAKIIFLEKTVYFYIPIAFGVLVLISNIKSVEDYLSSQLAIIRPIFVVLYLAYPILLMSLLFNKTMIKIKNNEKLDPMDKLEIPLFWFAKAVVFISNKVFSFVFYPIYHKIRYKNFRVFEKHTKTEPMETPINRPSEPAQETQKPNAQAVQSILDKLDKF